MAQVSALSRRPTIGQKSASWIGITFFLWGPCRNRPDTVGHSISTQHSYCYCVGLSIFLGLQRQHMRGTIFGMWGMTNSIRPFTLYLPHRGIRNVAGSSAHLVGLAEQHWGIVRLRARVVLRLRTNVPVVACSTGSSAGWRLVGAWPCRTSGSTRTAMSGRDSMGKRPLPRRSERAASELES